MHDFLIDTDILSIFAKADGLSILCRLLRCEKLPITPSVLDELLVPLEYGYDFPRDILSRADVVAVTPEEIEVYESLRLQGRLSTADAEMIAICKQRGWLYITGRNRALWKSGFESRGGGWCGYGRLESLAGRDQESKVA